MRFLHTGDWQLGMRRRFLGEEARARFAEARFEAVEALGEVARRQGCELVVVAGDVFESNQVARQTVVRALDALAAVGLPVYLLPGNHDPLDAGSVYRSAEFVDRKPANVHLIADDQPVAVAPGVEVVGAPWRSKRPGMDLVAALAARLEPAPGRLRIAVAHGAVDALAPDPSEPGVIGLAAAERALAEERFHYLALGDRHSTTRVHERAHYAGSPETTDFDEERPGRVLVVELSHRGASVEEHQVGRWSFVRRRFQVGAADDLARLESFLDELPDKSRTVLRLAFVGELSLAGEAELAALLEAARERFAAIDEWTLESDLVVLPDALDEDALGLAGFARDALEALRAEASGTAPATAGPDEEAPRPEVARAALSLLYRLARGLG